MNILSDTSLVSYGACPLRDDAPATSPLFEAAAETLQWALHASFAYTAPPEQMMREHFTEVWKTKTRDLKQYQKGLLECTPIVRRMRELFRRYQVIAPVSRYSWDVAGTNLRLQGAYAILQEPKEKVPQLVLSMLAKRPKHPEVPSLLDILHVGHCIKFRATRPVAVFHLPLLGGEAWRSRIYQGPLVTDWVRDILKSVQAGHRFPLPGEHCRNCISKACQEVFYAAD